MAEWSRIARRIRVPLGFAFAAFYVWIARPTVASIVIGTLTALPGILLRAFASGHVKKNEALATSGPYAHTRNPLYLGSFIMGVGFAIAARSVWVFLLMVGMVFLIYVPVIRAEETFLRQTFPDFDEYAHHVPRLWPRWSAYGSAEGAFSRPLYWQHREYNATLGTAALLAALVAKLVWASR